MYRPIKDYALIGNMVSSALLSKDASIDWAPMPYIHSPSVFASVLDDEKGGSWKTSSLGKCHKREQFYPGNTAIVVTRFHADTGVFEISDFMPIKKEGSFSKESMENAIFRRIACVSGYCEIESICSPRLDYARGETSLEKTETGSIVAKNGKKEFHFLSTGRETELKKGIIKNRFYLNENEVVYISLISLGKDQEPFHLSLEEYENEFEITRSFWEDWFSNGRYDLWSSDKTAEAVGRSATVLKLLTFESTGTVAAAPTTSLACDIGGVRNWDYRFSWVRDSSLALSSLSLLGYEKEVIDYIKWMLGVCVGPEGVDPKELKVLYDMDGKTSEGEELLEHLDGYCGSHPVRVGNLASEQYQKDIYGNLLDLIWKADFLWENENVSRSDLWMLVSSFADFIASVWHEADQSIWEFRMEPKHYVHSKVMSWVTLDRALLIAEKYDYKGNIKYWKEERDAIKNEVMERGWSEGKSSFVQFFESEEVDASLLVMPAVGFINGKDKRMVSTIEVIENELGVGDGLLLRYKNEDGLPGKDGAFLITSFWLVEALFLAGKKKRAERIYKDLILKSNHLGLLPEQIDHESGDFLGNFPQGYSHIGVINAGILLTGGDIR